MLTAHAACVYLYTLYLREVFIRCQKCFMSPLPHTLPRGQTLPITVERLRRRLCRQRPRRRPAALPHPRRTEPGPQPAGPAGSVPAVPGAGSTGGRAGAQPRRQPDRQVRPATPPLSPPPSSSHGWAARAPGPCPLLRWQCTQPAPLLIRRYSTFIRAMPSPP